MLEYTYLVFAEWETEWQPWPFLPDQVEFGVKYRQERYCRNVETEEVMADGAQCEQLTGSAQGASIGPPHCYGKQER